MCVCVAVDDGRGKREGERCVCVCVALRDYSVIVLNIIMLMKNVKKVDRGWIDR